MTKSITAPKKTITDGNLLEPVPEGFADFLGVIAENIEKVRIDKGVSVPELAARCQITVRKLRNILAGKIDIDIRLLTRIGFQLGSRFEIRPMKKATE